jgi:hypothetical protein
MFIVCKAMSLLSQNVDKCRKASKKMFLKAFLYVFNVYFALQRSLLLPICSRTNRV